VIWFGHCLQASFSFFEFLLQVLNWRRRAPSVFSTSLSVSEIVCFSCLIWPSSAFCTFVQSHYSENAHLFLQLSVPFISLTTEDGLHLIHSICLQMCVHLFLYVTGEGVYSLFPCICPLMKLSVSVASFGHVASFPHSSYRAIFFVKVHLFFRLCVKFLNLTNLTLKDGHLSAVALCFFPCFLHYLYFMAEGPLSCTTLGYSTLYNRR